VVAPLNGQVRAGDVVALDGPEHYFSIAYVGNPATVQALRVVADQVPWYFGTAGYPPGTQVSSVPDTGGRIFVIRAQGARPLPLPPGFRLTRTSCSDAICVDGYSR
jgi:hypothetical protein